jgi:hypothetical protein
VLCFGIFLAAPFFLWGILTLAAGTFYGRGVPSTGLRPILRGRSARILGAVMLVPFLVGLLAVVYAVLGGAVAFNLAWTGRLEAWDVYDAILTGFLVTQAVTLVGVAVCVAVLYLKGSAPPPPPSESDGPTPGAGRVASSTG